MPDKLLRVIHWLLRCITTALFSIFLINTKPYCLMSQYIAGNSDNALATVITTTIWKISWYPQKAITQGTKKRTLWLYARKTAAEIKLSEASNTPRMIICITAKGTHTSKTANTLNWNTTENCGLKIGITNNNNATTTIPKMEYSSPFRTLRFTNFDFSPVGNLGNSIPKFREIPKSKNPKWLV